MKVSCIWVDEAGRLIGVNVPDKKYCPILVRGVFPIGNSRTFTDLHSRFVVNYFLGLSGFSAELVRISSGPHFMRARSYARSIECGLAQVLFRLVRTA